MSVRDRAARPRTPSWAVLGGALLLLLILSLSAPSAQAAGPPGGIDNRGWEMVSPVEKNGGEVSNPAVSGAGSTQAAAAGGAFAFASTASFGEATGAAPLSQYLATRGAEGWSTANLTPPLLSGTYEADPYLLFSDDLARSLLSNGWSCRQGGEECEVENPPFASGALPGYRNLYLREGATYTPLLTVADTPSLTIPAAKFHLSLAGASPDLRHPIISTCAKLTAVATEVPNGGGGCEAAATNLYEWSAGSLHAINLLPGETLTTPGASLAAAEGAVSADGSRVYFTVPSGAIYLREAGQTKLLPETPAAGVSFQTATADGSAAFFLKGASLFRYDVGAETSTQIATEVQALLAASPDGAYLYYLTSAGIFRLHAGTATKILTGTPSHLPPATGPAGLSSDGARFFFTSSSSLLAADTDGRPDAYEWEAQGAGNCTKAPGCLGLVSSGRGGEAIFLGASSDATDAFFLTDGSLIGLDTGSRDIYDAREGGGFPEPTPGIPCEGDDCQGPPSAPEDPTPGTASYEGPENPPVHYPKVHCKSGEHRVVHKGVSRCVPKGHKKSHSHKKRRRLNRTGDARR